MSRLVKVCGITRREDALLSIKYGANALGFNFYQPSPRYIPPEEAATIIAGLPESVLTVGVFVERVDPEVAGLLRAVQLHGLEYSHQVPVLPQRILVATSPSDAGRFPDHEIIIDTSWGRGQLADWRALRLLQRRYVLSGGLTPENISRALELLDPAGVDVCSGVEAAPGVKDEAKLKAFLKAVRDWSSRDTSRKGDKGAIRW